MEKEISAQLLRLHIFPHKKGYSYLKEILVSMRGRNGIVENFIKDLYEPLAKNRGITVAAVIKAMAACIPNAIESDDFYSDCINIDGRRNLKEFLLKLYMSIFSH